MDIKKLKALLDIGRQMGEIRELYPLLESLMGLALDFVGAEGGYIVLVDNDDLVFRVGQDKDGNHLQEPQEGISCTIFDEVIKSRKGILTQDAPDSIDASSIPEPQMRSIICAPLISSGKILGAVYTESRSENKVFDKEDLELLESFAAQAAITIDNAVLFEDLEARVEARTAELSRANAKLKELAVTDPLTGVYNRRHFIELTEQELNRSQRYGHRLSAIILDLDQFKPINDQYGHLIGDRILQVAAQCIQDNIREVDILGRCGGDEFAILLPNTALPGTRDIAERVCEIIASQSVQAFDKSVPVSASLGVVSLEDTTGISVELLLDRGDQALLAAKQAGGHQVAVWEES